MSMTSDEQRVALAEWCGLLARKPGEVVEYQRFHPPDNVFQRVRFQDGSVRPCYFTRLPDYGSDLNAVNEAILELPRNKWHEFHYELAVLQGQSPSDPLEENYHKAITATSAQRCEALCRTLWPDRWKEAQ